MSAFKVYVIGKNEEGEFGLGHKQQISKLTKHTNVMNVIDVICADQYNIYVDDNNNYWMAGRNNYGQCGFRVNINGSNSITKLTQILYFKKNKIKISKVFASVSGSSTFWLSDKNKVYANGLNNSGQLGNGNKINQFKPILIAKELPQIIQIESTNVYSVALCMINIYMITRYYLRINSIKTIVNDIINLIKLYYGITHKTYSTTYSNHGGNGHPKWKFKQPKWKLIEALKDKDIIKISVGYQHSIFMESNGNVWAAGNNNLGQLGCKTVSGCRIPRQIQYFAERKIKIKDISCGYYHNLAMDVNNNVYCWGLNYQGQCGDGSGKNVLSTPTLNTLLFQKIKDIKCGAYHSCAITFDNKYYFWGSNCNNQCFQDNYTDLKIPQLCLTTVIFGDKACDKIIKAVSLGYACTILVVDEQSELNSK